VIEDEGSLSQGRLVHQNKEQVDRRHLDEFGCPDTPEAEEPDDYHRHQLCGIARNPTEGRNRRQHLTE